MMAYARFVVPFVLVTCTASASEEEHVDVRSDEQTLSDKTFAAGDTNQDGQLSRMEAVSFAKSENPDLANDTSFIQEVNEDVDYFDHDNSGSLSKAEFFELFKSDQEEESDGEEEEDGEEEDGEEEEDEDDADEEEDSEYEENDGKHPEDSADEDDAEADDDESKP
eukprot:TRINITY_DN11709_c0_g1_i1.p1 TRINITY_DN11709_c0_g1~~TRINITY_DN11709_c0_g1_i1.p1  ORF type:complete len:166 (-),score=59.46 TRINITY_DN11709_c0_g1_i1:50-547(-)